MSYSHNAYLDMSEGIWQKRLIVYCYNDVMPLV